MRRRAHRGTKRRTRVGSALLCFGAVAVTAPVSPTLEAQAAQPTAVQSTARRMTVTWTAAPIRDVLMSFSVFSGKSIVAGASVSGSVTASINDRPWDVALATILSTQGLVAVEDEYGIIRVDDMGALDSREAIAPIVTRAYRIAFADVQELQAALAPLLSARGSMSVSTTANSLIVSDIARVHRAIASLLRRP